MVNQSENQGINDSTGPLAQAASPAFSSVDMTAKQDSDLVSEMRKGNSSASACLNSLQIDMDDTVSGAVQKTNAVADIDPGIVRGSTGAADLDPGIARGGNGEPDLDPGIARGEAAIDPGFFHRSGPNEPVNDPGFFHKPDWNEPVNDPGFFHKPDWNEPVNDPGIFYKPGKGSGNDVHDPGHWVSGGNNVHDPGHWVSGGNNVHDPGHWRPGTEPGHRSGDPGPKHRAIRASDLVDDRSLRSIAYDQPSLGGKSTRSIAFNIPASDAASAAGPAKGGKLVPANPNLKPGSGGDNTGGGGDQPSQTNPRPTTADDIRATTEPAPTKKPSPVTISPVEVGRRPRGVSPMKP